jgi:hypothetical protein
MHLEAELHRSLDGLAVHPWRAPVDRLEQPELQRAKSDQVVATVVTWPYRHIGRALQGRCRVTDRTTPQRRVVAANHNHPLEAAVEVVLEGEFERRFEASTALRHEAYRGRDDLAQQIRGTRRVDHAHHRPAEPQAYVDDVEQECRVQVGCLLWAQRRDQPRLGPARLGRFSDNDQRIAHPNREPTPQHRGPATIGSISAMF